MASHGNLLDMLCLPPLVCLCLLYVSADMLAWTLELMEQGWYKSVVENEPGTVTYTSKNFNLVIGGGQRW